MDTNMDMNTMSSNLPDWLGPLAWVFLGLACASAVAIAIDIWALGHRYDRFADSLVMVGAALYLGPLALVLHARAMRAMRAAHGRPAPRDASNPRRSSAATLPGGTASAVAHLVGVPLVIAAGWTIAGINLWVMILVIAIFAALLLVAYDRSVGAYPVGVAVGSALLTVAAFDLGMGGWMLLLHFNDLMPAATEGSFWFLMQIGIVLGLITGYPAVAWLSRRRRTPNPVVA